LIIAKHDVTTKELLKTPAMKAKREAKEEVKKAYGSKKVQNRMMNKEQEKEAKLGERN
jgi:hypothetical protein